MLVRMWNNRDFHTLLVGVRSGTAPLKDSLAICYKSKHALSYYDPAFALLSVYPNGVENFCPHRNLHVDVYSSLFMLPQTWKQPRCFIVGEWTNAL